METSWKFSLFVIVLVLGVTKVLSNQKNGYRFSFEELLTNALTSRHDPAAPKKIHENDILLKQLRMRRAAPQNVLRSFQNNYASNNYDHNELYPVPKNLASSLVDQVMTYKMNNSLPNSLQKIRLRANRTLNPNEGRVEILQNNRWGLICDDYWRDTDANVACRQLGFKRGASRAYRGARYGVAGIPSDGAISGYMSCTGTEKHLQKCSQVVQANSCKVENTASVQCIYNTGCPRDWHSFHGLCYRVETEPTDFETARQRCSSNGAQLIAVLSLEENNFISNMLATKFKNLTSVWTGGMYGYFLQNEVGHESWAWRGTVHNINTGSSFEAWFPGFKIASGSLDGTSRPLQPLNKRSCLALNSIYKMGNKFVDTQYFWWDNVSCKQRMPFVCQKVASSTDCYNKATNGRDYVGEVSRTESGSPCQPWSANVVGNLTPFEIKDFTSESNFCRNPDNDTKPWCWVDYKNFVYGYCDLRECSLTTKSPAGGRSFELSGYGKGPCSSELFYCPTMESYSDRTCIESYYVCDGIADCFIEEEDENEELCKRQCSSEEFLCVNDNLCIAKSKLCDGIPNCYDGSDESDCSNRGMSPILNNEFILRNYVKATLSSTGAGNILEFINLNIMLCASKCITPNINYNRICYGFNFLTSTPEVKEQTGIESTCQLIFVPDSQMQLMGNSRSRWYASKNVNFCDEAAGNKFRCRNQRCINKNLKCNVFDDCGDFSDENDCAYSATVAPPVISLVNKLQRGVAEGRIEINYRGETGMLCDNDFNINDGHVICRQLGFPKALRVLTNTGPLYGKGNEQFLLERLECTGTESSVFKCAHLEWKRNRCTAAQNVAGLICAENRGCRVNEFRCDDGPGKQYCIPLTMVCDGNRDCYGNADEKNCASIQIKLTGGPDSNLGIVEIIRNDIVGTICKKQFSIESAQVICRQLGIPGEARLVTSGQLNGRGVVWLESIRCDGSETSISQCPHSGWGVSTMCDHKDDVIIECGLKQSTTIVMPTTTSLVTRTEYPCGRRPIPEGRQRARVVGGYDVRNGSFPWQVGIRKINRFNTDQHCGGTILNEFWIMTAAHCFSGQTEKNKFELRVGDHNNTVPDAEEQVHKIEAIIIHEQYTGRLSYNNDAALLKIAPDESGKGIRFSNAVQPACLPASDVNTDDLQGYACQVSGWGTLKSGIKKIPKILQAADIPLLSRKDCNTMYPNQITQGMICAGHQRGLIDSCQGDSGGPLVCDIEGKHTLIGAVSWGTECAKENLPGVYVNIPYFVDWIESKINDN